MTTHGHVERHAPTTSRLFGWLDSDFPVWPGLRLFDTEHAMRCEEYVEGDRYVLRAELPGIDPDKDVQVSIDTGVLTIRAERTRTRRDDQRSEFFYGRLARSMTLPKGTDETSISATYRDGILEVVMTLAAARPDSHTIAVQRGR